MKLPIQFKYFEITAGFVEGSKDSPGFEGYMLKDLSGVQVAAGTSLAGLVAHATSLDINHEVQEQFVARRLPTLDHLEGIDIDATPDRPSGILTPQYGNEGPPKH